MNTFAKDSIQAHKQGIEVKKRGNFSPNRQSPDRQLTIASLLFHETH